jgi:hypothetical protein
MLSPYHFWVFVSSETFLASLPPMPSPYSFLGLRFFRNVFGSASTNAEPLFFLGFSFLLKHFWSQWVDGLHGKPTTPAVRLLVCRMLI